MKRASELPKSVERPSEEVLYGLMVSLFNFMVTSYGWETETESKRELAGLFNDWLEADFSLERIDFES